MRHQRATFGERGLRVVVWLAIGIGLFQAVRALMLGRTWDIVLAAGLISWLGWTLLGLVVLGALIALRHLLGVRDPG